MKKDKKIFNFLEVTFIAVIVSTFMCFIGAFIVYKHLGGINFSLLKNDSNIVNFLSAYNNLLDNYYGEIDNKTLIDGAIEGMYSKTGDPYTTYLDENNAKALEESLDGYYIGIGIVILQGDQNEEIIYQIVPESPAEKAGLMVGDKLVRINDEDVTTKGGDYIVDLIDKLGKFNLTVNRNGQEISYSLAVEKIYNPNAYSRIIEENGKNIGYIQITGFNSTIDMQVSTHLNRLEKSGIDGLVIDLRNNSGGYLDMAKNVAEMFLEKGKVIYGLNGKESDETVSDNTDEKRSYPINIIINNATASAAEILAGALKYSYNATLIGKTSYGKGKVQEISSLSDGTQIKYTTATWSMPNGECIDKKGIKPDIEVELEQALDKYSDNQIMTAVKNLAEN